MKSIKGPAHPINVPCRRCKVPAGEDCHVVVCGKRCPERERDNHRRLTVARERKEAAESAERWAKEMHRAADFLAEQETGAALVDGNRAIATTLEECARLLREM